jgi:O-antigen/teichoic acid export membrane protein
MKSISVSRNVLSGFLAWLLPLGLTFALTPLIVHRLGAEAYGLYALVMGFISYTFTSSIGRAITRYISAYRAGNQTERIGEVLSSSFVLNLCLSVMSAGALVLATNWLVTRVLNIEPRLQSQARLAFYLVSLGLLFAMLTQVFSAVPQAMQRFDVYSLIATSTGIATIIGNGLLVWTGFGVNSLIAWNVVVTALACAAYFISSRRLLPEARLTLRVKKDLLVGIIRFSGAVTAYQVLGSLLLIFERSWLTRTLGPAAVTYFVVPMTIAIYIHAFIGSLSMMIFPMASEADARQDKDRLYLIYTRALKYIAMLVLFLVITLAVGSHQILSNWMGVDFAQHAAGVLAIQAVVFGVMAMGSVTWQVAEGLGYPGRNALLVLLWVIVAIPLIIWLTPLLGIEGVALARLAGMLSVPVYTLYIERLIFGRCLWEFWGRTGLLLALSGLGLAILQAILFNKLPAGWLSLLASIAFSGSLFFGALWLAGYLDQDERAWMRRFLGRATNALRAPDLA